MRTILAAADLSPYTGGFTHVAAELASETGATLHLIHVIEPPSGFSVLPRSGDELDARLAKEEADVLERLAALAEQLGDAGLTIGSLTCVRGEPADEIVARANELDADLIVVGAHAKGPVVRAVIGSVSTAILKDAGRPVLVLPPRQATETEQPE